MRKSVRMGSFSVFTAISCTLLYTFSTHVNSYENGAPCSAVESMTPGHGYTSTYENFIIEFLHWEQDNIAVPCYQQGKPIRGELVGSVIIGNLSLHLEFRRLLFV